MKKNYENIIKLYNYAKRKLNEVLEHVKLCKISSHKWVMSKQTLTTNMNLSFAGEVPPLLAVRRLAFVRTHSC